MESLDEDITMPLIKFCVRCQQNYFNTPALSRRDNATDICPTCGTEEAIVDLTLALHLDLDQRLRAKEDRMKEYIAGKKK